METKNKKGFTLVELLVVIAIIGILSTVAVVNLNSSRKKAKETAALQAISSYTTAAIFCESEGGELTLPVDFGPPPTYLGGTEVCTTPIGIYWPDNDDLPEGYSIIYSFTDVPGDSYWTYGMAPITGSGLNTIVCNNDPDLFVTYGNGCRVQ